MDAVKAIVKGGRVELLAPPEWPDGTEVVVRPVVGNGGLGVPEEDWGDGLEAAARWLEWYDSLEPLLFTEEERASWETARLDRKALEKATFASRAEELGRVWE